MSTAGMYVLAATTSQVVKLLSCLELSHPKQKTNAKPAHVWFWCQQRTFLLLILSEVGEFVRLQVRGTIQPSNWKNMPHAVYLRALDNEEPGGL